MVFCWGDGERLPSWATVLSKEMLARGKLTTGLIFSWHEGTWQCREAWHVKMKTIKRNTAFSWNVAPVEISCYIVHSPPMHTCPIPHTCTLPFSIDTPSSPPFSNRISSTQCLRHPWLTSKSPKHSPNLSTTRLKSYVSSRKWQVSSHIGSVCCHALCPCCHGYHVIGWDGMWALMINNSLKLRPSHPSIYCLHY